MSKRRYIVAALFVYVSLSLCSRISAECLTTVRDKNGTVLETKNTKAAAKALIESGRPLAISLGVFAGFGFLAGTDLYPLLYHGAWLANAQFVPSLEVDYHYCKTYVADKNDKKATKTTCPCDFDEKFFTKWSRYFGPFSCRFGILPPKSSLVEPRNPEYMQANALDTAVGVGIVLVSIVLARLPGLIITRNYYKDGTDEASNYGAWSKCPQNRIPCFPIRYWMDFPNVSLKFLLCIHIGLALAAAGALDGNNLIGAIILVVICVVLPIFSFIKVRSLIKGKVTFVDANRFRGWRDVESRNTNKTWRQSVFVNRYGALFANLKPKRWWWYSYRMFFNLLEALVILGLPLPNDVRAAIIVLLYFIQALVFLMIRPYLSTVNWALEMLQLFHNVFIYMASTLYNHDSKIFNAQDIMQIETDGVEDMMMVLGSGMTCIHIIAVFFQAASTVYSSLILCQKGGDEAEWDVECNDKRGVATLKSDDDDETKPRRQITQRKTGYGGSWVMKKIDSGPVLRHEEDTQTNANPLRAKIAAKRAAAAEARHEEVTQTNANPLRAKIAAKRAAATEARQVEMTVGKEKIKETEEEETEEEEKEDVQPVVESPAATGPAPLREGWGEAVDPGTGVTYYYNTVTHETQWERPT